MTDVRCIECAKFSVQRARTYMQRQGFGACERRPDFVAFRADRLRDCEHFENAAADVIAKRERWLREVNAEIGVREAERTRFLTGEGQANAG